MARLRLNLAVVALVASHVLIAAASLWHDHDHGASSAQSEAANAHADCPSHAPERTPSAPAPAEDHDDCLICQIVTSQRIDTIERTVVPLATPVAFAPRAPPAPARAGLDHAPPRSRAPPPFDHA